MNEWDAPEGWALVNEWVHESPYEDYAVRWYERKPGRDVDVAGWLALFAAVG